MSRASSRTPRHELQRRLRGFAAERQDLLAQLANIGFIWHGSINRRLQICGQRRCRCRVDPAARHGPYAYWTTKIAGRTVSRMLKPEEADLYEEWIENRRRIETIVAALKRLSEQAAPIVLELCRDDAGATETAR